MAKQYTLRHIGNNDLMVMTRGKVYLVEPQEVFMLPFNPNVPQFEVVKEEEVDEDKLIDDLARLDDEDDDDDDDDDEEGDE